MTRSSCPSSLRVFDATHDRSPDEPGQSAPFISDPLPRRLFVVYPGTLHFCNDFQRAHCAAVGHIVCSMLITERAAALCAYVCVRERERAYARARARVRVTMSVMPN